MREGPIGKAVEGNATGQQGSREAELISDPMAPIRGVFPLDVKIFVKVCGSAIQIKTYMSRDLFSPTTLSSDT